MTPEVPLNGDLGVSKENRERPLEGKVALIPQISGCICAETAIVLAKEGVEIIGIVGNSQKEREKAKKLAIHIEYSGGDIELIREDVTLPEGRKRLQDELGNKGLDIIVLSVSGPTAKAANDLVSEFFPRINEGGTIVLEQSAHRNGEVEQCLRSRIPEFQAKGVSFVLVSSPEDAYNKIVAQKVTEVLKREGVPTGYTHTVL